MPADEHTIRIRADSVEAPMPADDHTKHTIRLHADQCRHALSRRCIENGHASVRETSSDSDHTLDITGMHAAAAHEFCAQVNGSETMGTQADEECL